MVSENLSLLINISKRQEGPLDWTWLETSWRRSVKLILKTRLHLLVSILGSLPTPNSTLAASILTSPKVGSWTRSGTEGERDGRCLIQGLITVIGHLSPPK